MVMIFFYDLWTFVSFFVMCYWRYFLLFGVLE